MLEPTQQRVIPASSLKHPEVAVVFYNAGNVKSMQFALERLGAKVIITDNPDIIRQSPRVIFPGVGEASYAMDQLRSRGLVEVLQQLEQPFLGVCLGMQLMCKSTEESTTLGLGIFDSLVKRFLPGDEKVPHMGWNTVTSVQENGLLGGVESSSCFYFVHSYYATIGEHTLGETFHMIPFSSVLQRDNYYGVQFHPEKSSVTGSKLLYNFLTME